jgi:hypothetical protein
MSEQGGLSGTEVKLVSSDEREFSVPVEIASMSVTVKNMLDGALFVHLWVLSLFFPLGRFSASCEDFLHRFLLALVIPTRIFQPNQDQ